MKKRKYIYEIQYASGLLRSNGNQTQLICSPKELKINQFIVVEHEDCGVFIGKVLKLHDEIEPSQIDEYNWEYQYLQDIDLSKWEDEIKKKERIEELQIEMEHKFAEIDKKKKFEYYAEIDDDFRELYLEYNNLVGGKK